MSKISTPLQQQQQTKRSKSKQQLLRSLSSSDDFDKESRYHGGVINGGLRHGHGRYEYKVGGNGMFQYKGIYYHYHYYHHCHYYHHA